MRKLFFKIEMTLDGFISGSKGDMELGTATFGAEENWKRVAENVPRAAFRQANIEFENWIHKTPRNWSI
jgi:hypothetical protein